MATQFVQKLVSRLYRGFIVALHDMEDGQVEPLLDVLFPIQPIPFPELVRRSKEGKPTAGLCALTVDDGISRTAEAVLRVCRKRYWPVTFFVPTDKIERRLWNAYEWWRSVQPHLPGRTFMLSTGEVSFAQPDSIARVSSTMERLWHTALAAQYEPFTLELAAAVAQALNVPRESLEPAPALTWEQVESLSRDPLVAFESHGVTHTALSALPEEEVHRELKLSRDLISEHTAQPCRHFCYPFGSPRAIGTVAPALARRYYESAVTMSLGHVDSADAWQLPRIPIYPENSAALVRTKLLLKCSRFQRAAALPLPAGGPLETPNQAASS